jgi:hypothetical protein
MRAIGSVAALLLVNLGVTELLRLVSNLAGWPHDVHTRAAIAIGGAIIGEAVFLFLLIWWLREQGLTLTDLGVSKRPKLWALAAALTHSLLHMVR